MRADFQLAIGQLRRRPGFVIGAVLSLAIGMSLATALFSVVDAVLFRPLPFGDPERLVHLYETSTGVDASRLPPRFLTTVQSNGRAFSDVAAYSRARIIVGRSGEARTVDAFRVTANFFDALRARPAHGTTFAVDGQFASGRSAIISHSLWTTQFGGDSQVVGRAIPINGIPHVVVGVMPPGFDYPDHGQIWLPLQENVLIADANSSRDDGWSPYYAFARLAKGTTLEMANTELALLYRRVYADERSRRLMSSRAVPLRDYLTFDLRAQLRLWVAAACLISILCAVNFATMSLARGMRRRDDIALRAALGASKGRIIQMLVAEAVLLAALGGAAAVLLAYWLLSFANAWFAQGTMTIAPTISWETILFGLVATALVGFLFALAPAIDLAAVDLSSIMRSGATATTSRSSELRGRRALVGLQLCLAVTAVAVITALIKADRRYGAADIGFDYSPLVMADVAVTDTVVQKAALEPLLERVRQVPGVATVATLSGCDGTTIWGERDLTDGRQAMSCVVSADYFAALGVAPTAGHVPAREEIATGSKLAAISRTEAVQSYGTERAALGQRLRLKRIGRPVDWVTVVAVVPEIGAGLFGISASIYNIQQQPSAHSASMVVRLRDTRQFRVAEISRAFVDGEAGISVSDVSSARAIVERARGATRGRLLFLGSVAVLAFVLAVVGVYGLTSYTTELRARELGIRIALGASRSRLAYVVVNDLWWMAVVGITVGIVASGRLVNFLDAFVRTPATKGAFVTLPLLPTFASAVALFGIMLLGTAVPLRRVLRLDVMRTIQGEAGS